MYERHKSQNKKVGSIEHVGDDGFIVESVDPSDPNFFGGKRLFKDFDSLLRFLSTVLEASKSTTRPSGLRGFDPLDIERERQQLNGGNGLGGSVNLVEATSNQE